jgi:hypothetical protein
MLRLHFNPEDEVSRFLRNAGNDLPDQASSHEAKWLRQQLVVETFPVRITARISRLVTNFFQFLQETVGIVSQITSQSLPS